VGSQRYADGSIRTHAISNEVPGGDQMRIDIHNHFTPERIVQEMEKRGLRYGIRIKRNQEGFGTLVLKWESLHTFTKDFIDPDQRLRDMDAAGIDKATVSLATPGLSWADAQFGLTLSQIANDEICKIVQRHPDRFIGIASVSLKNVHAAIGELKRAISMGMKGVLIDTNIDGKQLDSPDLSPFYEAVQSLDVPIFVHPANPAGHDRPTKYRLDISIRFPFETCLAIGNIIYGGVLERYPKLRFCFAHLGGAVPFLRERMEAGYKVFPACGRNIPKPPSEYLKLMYFDTAGKSGITPPSFHKPAFQCAYEAMGSDRLLLGTDHPFGKGNMPNAVRFIEELEILSQKDKEKILSKNAISLLGL
jgi:aminocarboxymuconate-semialdehyde decarboxylase